MCTLALGYRLFDETPLLVAANRDENYDRPSAEPYLDGGNPKFIAGRDRLAGGTWLGVNENGLLAGILNRRSNGNPLQGASQRSRGLLCMDLLCCKSAAAAADFIGSHGVPYSPFIVVFADTKNAFAAYNQNGRIHSRRLDAGLHVFSSVAEEDSGSPNKADRARKQFAQAFTPPGDGGAGRGEWIAPLKNVLADHTLYGASKDPGDALCVHRERSGTVSSSIVVFAQADRCFEMFYCPGPPCQNDFGSAVQLKVR